MDKSKAIEFLEKLFVPRDNDLDGVAFKSEYMKTESDAYPIYCAVSQAQEESGLSFNFSYRIANKAVDVLVECDDWSDDEELNELIGGEVPVYTADIMEIYQSDSWAVDESDEEYGKDGDSTQRAMIAWNSEIMKMVERIKEKIENIT